jgi:hypothetical protein
MQDSKAFSGASNLTSLKKNCQKTTVKIAAPCCETKVSSTNSRQTQDPKVGHHL